MVDQGLGNPFAPQGGPPGPAGGGAGGGDSGRKGDQHGEGEAPRLHFRDFKVTGGRTSRANGTLEAIRLNLDSTRCAEIAQTLQTLALEARFRKQAGKAKRGGRMRPATGGGLGPKRAAAGCDPEFEFVKARSRRRPPQGVRGVSACMWLFLWGGDWQLLFSRTSY